jgi:hypothetical protein
VGPPASSIRAPNGGWACLLDRVLAGTKPKMTIKTTLPSIRGPCTVLIDRNIEYFDQNIEYFDRNMKYFDGNIEYFDENGEYFDENIIYFHENIEYFDETIEYFDENIM